MSTLLTRAGFDEGRLAYAIRTAIAASIAFVLAWWLGLEHPQWAGMAVWAASQPTRGQLMEKSLFRVVGTVIGSIAGVLLVLGSHVHPALLVVGLSLWVALCTGAGNLARGFVAYGAVLAGYTAAMVSLLDAAHPDQVLALGADRMATVLTGVVVAAAIGYVFAPPADGGGLRKRVIALLADLLDRAARPAPAHADAADQSLLHRIAEAEEMLDAHGAGSIRSRRMVRATRDLLIAAIALLLWRRGRGRTFDSGVSAAGLQDAAQALRAGQFGSAARALEQVAAAGNDVSEAGLDAALAPLAAALRAWSPEGPDRAEPALPQVLHRDWVGAREAMIRAGGTMLVFGAIWLATGWQAGAFMLLGLSVMLSLFSTFPSPTQMMRFVFVGQLLGVLGALACRWLVWPLAGSELQMILLTLPFILLGPLLVGHRRTTAASFDYNMVVLLMLQPHWPLEGSFAHSAMAGLAVVAAPLAAFLAYSFIYPASLRRRSETMLEMMRHDLADLAADPQALQRRTTWQARLYHRTLRLVRSSERSARANEAALEVSLALLTLGHAVFYCHGLLADPATTASDRRAARAALARVAQFRVRPERAGSALSHLALRRRTGEAEMLRAAAAGIRLVAPRPTA
ncbi:FUSC family protein [Pseudooceanicola nanhaiensis]|uniref:FUSC family protein n=1 Tax=Pseudooceanicola nanhaiensis TaxID=375761 RepID=UPI001CD2BF3F|nr:FUSC family protein [Pseudooceanicola nanhaiensis]MCA0920487.1 FUSC family protein [Pseudooceanicola nanhaiensis]